MPDPGKAVARHGHEHKILPTQGGNAEDQENKKQRSPYEVQSAAGGIAVLGEVKGVKFLKCFVLFGSHGERLVWVKILIFPFSEHIPAYPLHFR